VTLTWLTVEPLDTVMVRDGRPFDAGSSAVARGVTPPPNTLGGVARAALGGDVDRIVGPLIAVDGVIAFPAPADLVVGGSGLRRLTPIRRHPDARTDLDADHRLSHNLQGDGEPADVWLTGTGMRRWLDAEDDMAAGQKVETSPTHGEAPWLPETRLGLARSPDGELAGTSIQGLLYTMTHLRPRDHVSFVIGCVAAQRVTVREDLVPFGGRGRLAQVAEWDGFDRLPAPPADFRDGRVAVYLATPALLAETFWEPRGATLCAVASMGPRPVASAQPGADFAATRLLAWMVPAGSVYYLQFDDEAALGAFVRDYHGDLIPNGSTQRITTAGFGTCLMGRW
jgi:CRISPR-associated protein Cmr3